MLQVEDGVIVTNSRLQHPLSVIGGRGSHNFYARSMKEPCLRGCYLGSLASYLCTRRRTTNDDGHRGRSSPVHLHSHMHKLVKITGNEIDHLHFGDWTHAHQGCTYCRTNHSRLRHRSIDNTFRAKLLEQVGVDIKGLVTRIFGKK